MIGFKSFASRTKIEFRSGIMAVVGPNGCGKTNIVDAIRWVLGEQRTSALRAERMESVIFNGTPHRRPLGMTEVTLAIENTNGVLPSPYSEVAITRRLYRSGESEYLINRNPSRLRDINDLFADTGLGNSAYSIIELSMVEGIISGPSDMRRLLFEEAAGVAKFKSRRQAALRRLETTGENLARIDDIFKEVEKRYRSLKRQASRAQRYKEVTRAIQLRLTIDLSNERLEILNKRIPIEEKLGELEDELHEAETAATRATSELLSLEGQELSIIDKARRTQDNLKKIERREVELDRELALTEQRIKFLEEETGKADQRRNELTDRIKYTGEQAENAGKECDSLEKQLENSQSKLDELEKNLTDLAADLETARDNLTEKRNAETEARHAHSSFLEKAKGREDELLHLRKRQQALNDQLAGLQARRKETGKSLADARQRLKEAQKVQKTAVKGDREAVEKLSFVRKEHGTALTEQAGAAAELEAVRIALSAHRSRAGSLTSRPKSLLELAEKEKLSSIADRIECRTEHRAAVAAALSGILEALDRPDFDAVIELSRGIEKDKQAVLRFPLDTKKTAIELKMPPGAGDCLSGPSLIKNKGEFGDFLHGRLANLLLVPDRETLTLLAPVAIKQNLRLVTTDGELFEPDGILHAGRVDPEAQQVGWLERLRELEKKDRNLQNAHKKAERSAVSLAEKLTEAEHKTVEIRKSLLNAEETVGAENRKTNDLESDLTRFEQRIVELTSERDQIDGIIESLPLPEGFEERVKELEADERGSEEARKRGSEELRETENQQREMTGQRAVVNTEAARYGERLEGAKKSVERFTGEAESATEDLARLNARIAESGTEHDRVRQAGENIRAQIELNNSEKNDVLDVIESVRRQRNELKEKRAVTTNRLNDAQEKQKLALKERSGLEADVIGFRERLREVDRRLSEDADVKPDAVSEMSLANAEAELQEANLHELSLDRLKTRLQSMGLVNMLALEELPDVEERYRFLSDQKVDLEKGIEVLEETIDRINHEARRIFRDTFDKICVNFHDIFHLLFEGGEAQVTLMDGDPLEADISILATPSGKKLQPLTMLSGGEKALTAIALLFAIYKVRPSPFCVLDEVDAPLDDANVNRFNRLIRRFAVDTQFLIVTHNKRTMEAADCLYGVTLSEDASSRMVSVKIEGSETDDENAEEQKPDD